MFVWISANLETYIFNMLVQCFRDAAQSTDKRTYRCNIHFLNEIWDKICCYAQMCSDIYQAGIFELGTLFKMCKPAEMVSP